MPSRQRPSTPELAVAPPAFLGRWQVWALFLVLLLVPFFVPIPRALRYHPVIGHFGDQLHIPLLGAIYLLFYWKGRLRGRIWLGAAAAAAVGGAIEFLQKLVGRGTLFEDWLLDLLGIATVIAFLLWRGRGSRLSLAVLLALLISILMQSYYIPPMIMATYECRERFPFLEDFDSPHAKYLWDERFSSRVSIQPRSDTESDQSLRLLCPANKSWPGAVMKNFPGDWRGFTQLVFSARISSEGLDSLAFGVRLDDWESRQDGNWLADRFIATEKWKVYRLSLEDRQVQSGERFFDTSDVVSIHIFVTSPQQDLTLEIDDLYLQ